MPRFISGLWPTCRRRPGSALCEMFGRAVPALIADAVCGPPPAGADRHGFSAAQSAGIPSNFAAGSSQSTGCALAVLHASNAATNTSAAAHAWRTRLLGIANHSPVSKRASSRDTLYRRTPIGATSSLVFRVPPWGMIGWFL